MSNQQFENMWVCVSLPRIESCPGNTWVYYVWKRLADLDFCADVDSKITAAKDRFFDDYYSAMKPGHGLLEVPIENPFFGKEREEIEIELDLLGSS